MTMFLNLRRYDDFTKVNENSRRIMPSWANVFEMLEHGKLKRIDFSYEDAMNTKIQLNQKLRTLYKPICELEDVKQNFVICPDTIGFKKRVIIIFDSNDPLKIRAIMGDPTGDIKEKNITTFGNLLIFPSVDRGYIDDVCFYDREKNHFVVMEEINKTLSKNDWSMIKSLDLISRFKFDKWKINISSTDINIIDSENGRRYSWAVND